MNKEKQLALGTLFGLPPGHSLMKDLLADPDIVALAEVAVIDKAAQKGVIDKKSASRKISRLTKALNSANA